ncbi:hypothetical protein, partial [Mycolicibacterium insubricum]|uniref:hypothetical protein n=1 Tax=Mycolicibacterium insubricum TaxID=444597 RepID=UPI0021F3979C
MARHQSPRPPPPRHFSCRSRLIGRVEQIRQHRPDGEQFPFVKGLGRRTHLFTSSSQDTSNRLLASQLLYGAPLSVPIPD